jgi:myosin protein heavy chain
MSQKEISSHFDQVVLVSLPARVEQRFTPAVRRVLGQVEVTSATEGDLSNGLAQVERALFVLNQAKEEDNGLDLLKGLRERGVATPVLLLANGKGTDLESELDDLAPALTFPANGFRKAALSRCLKRLGSEVEARQIDAAQAAADAAAQEPAVTEGEIAQEEEEVPSVSAAEAPAEAEPEADVEAEVAPTAGADLPALGEEEAALLASLEQLRQRRDASLESVLEQSAKDRGDLAEITERLAKVEESLNQEKRQRWEVVLDLRESQEHAQELEQRLARARDGEAQRQTEIDGLRRELQGAQGEVGKLSEARDELDSKLKSVREAQEEDQRLSSERVAELEASLAAAEKAHEEASAESAAQIERLGGDLEAAEKLAGEAEAEQAAQAKVQAGLEEELAALRDKATAASADSEQSIQRLSEEGAALTARLAEVTTLAETTRSELEAELTSVREQLAEKDASLSEAIAAEAKLEQELGRTRAASLKEKEETKAWTRELEAEAEKLRGQLSSGVEQADESVRRLEAEMQALKTSLDAEAQARALAVAEHEKLQAELSSDRAALDEARQVGADAAAAMELLQTEKAELEASLRASSQEHERTAELQREVDGLVQELADKEEAVARLMTAKESAESKALEASAAMAREKEEAGARVAALTADRGDLDRRVQEAREHSESLERQVNSLKAKVVELEVAREEDAEKLSEAVRAPSPTVAPAPVSDVKLTEVSEERDRLKREMESLRVEAESTRRALADSDARLRKLQQERAKEESGSDGDEAIQALRAELGSLGD